MTFHDPATYWSKCTITCYKCLHLTAIFATPPNSVQSSTNLALSILRPVWIKSGKGTAFGNLVGSESRAVSCCSPVIIFFLVLSRDSQTVWGMPRVSGLHKEFLEIAKIPHAPYRSKFRYSSVEIILLEISQMFWPTFRAAMREIGIVRCENGASQSLWVIFKINK